MGNRYLRVPSCETASAVGSVRPMTYRSCKAWRALREILVICSNEVTRLRYIHSQSCLPTKRGNPASMAIVCSSANVLPNKGSIGLNAFGCLIASLFDGLRLFGGYCLLSGRIIAVSGSTVMRWLRSIDLPETISVPCLL